MLPNLVFLWFLTFYVMVMFESYVIATNEQKAEMETVYRVSQGVVLTFILYFAMMEVIQMMKDRRSYFASLWNYFDIAIIIIISATIGLDSLNTDNKVQRRMYAVSIFVMWIKTMYYLRVFRKVGYLTSMIVKVLSDLKYFMLILAMSILAFANAFYILSMNNDVKK